MIQLTDKLYCIEVPIEAKDIHIDRQNMLWYWTPNEYYPNEEDADCANYIQLKSGWELAGTVTAYMVNFDCSQYVPQPINEEETPQDYLISLIERKSGKTFVNKLSHPDLHYTESERGLWKYEELLKEWKSAEEKKLQKVVVIKNIQ